MIDVNTKIPSLGLEKKERNPKILELQMKIQELQIDEKINGNDNSEEIKRIDFKVRTLVSLEPKNPQLELMKMILPPKGRSLLGFFR